MKRTTGQDYQERMLRVLLHIRDNLDGNPGLDELAGAVDPDRAVLLPCQQSEEDMDVKIVKEGDLRVAFVRHTAPTRT